MVSGETRNAECITVSFFFLATRHSPLATFFPRHSPLATRHYFHRQPDVTCFISVFGRIREQVHDHLFQPCRIGVQPDGLRRQGNGKFMPTLFNQRAHGLNRPFNDVAHGDRDSAKLNHSRGNARDFQQIVHQMLELNHLAFDDRPGLPLHQTFCSSLQSEHLYRIGNWCERTS